MDNDTKQQRIGAYKVLRNLGVEIRFKLDSLGVDPKTGNKVKELIDGYAEGVKSERISIPSWSDLPPSPNRKEQPWNTP